MFTLQDLELLLSEDVRRAIDANIDRRPTDIALDGRVPSAAAVATQVKRLQRAAAKLPSYYAVRAVLPPRAYEQSSSEECAARKRLSGGSVLDLTCGLGVDAAALARRFERVVTLERDETLAAVARHNLRLLGVENVEVVCASAEEYVARHNEHFDWCFADPDRRGERGEKLVRLEDCSPNVVEMMPALRRIAERICIKCSPLFDTAEPQRLFGDCSVETVSIGGECKEVNIYIDGEPSVVAAEAVGIGRFEVETSRIGEYRLAEPPEDLSEYGYVVLPDVALQHSRLTCAALSGVAELYSWTGVALAKSRPEGVLGRVFAIGDVLPFEPKRLKKRFKGERMDILRRDFPMSNAEIATRLGVREGGSAQWCFTRIGEKLFAIELKKA